MIQYRNMIRILELIWKISGGEKMRKRDIGMKMITALLSAAMMTASVTGCGTENEAAKTDASSKVETKSAADVKESTSGFTETAESSSVSGSESTSEEDKTTPDDKLIIVSFPSEYRNHWNEDKNYGDIEVRVDGIQIMSDGYEKLQQTITKCDKKLWDDSEQIYNESLEDIKEFQDDDRNFTCTYDNTVKLKRADSSVFSYERTEYSYLGGAHPSTLYAGYAYDTLSGRQLCLDDVTDDKDKIYEEVMKQLEESEDSSAFFDGWQDTIKKWFDNSGKTDNTGSDTEDGTEESHLNWYLDETGLSVIVNAYDIGPYAMGSRKISIPYDAGLIKKEYCAELKYPAQDVALYEGFTYTDVDGNEKSVYLSADENGDDDEYRNIVLNIAKAEDDTSPVKITLSGYYLESMYLVTAPDGGKYLYVDSISDNDWNELDVIDMNSDEPQLIKNSDDGALYDFNILDSDSFVMATRVGILGTYNVYRTYHVGNDGTPEADEDEYTIINDDYDWAERHTGESKGTGTIPELDNLPYYSALKTKCDISVMMHVDGSDEKKQETIPAGTVCIPYKTDVKTYVTFRSLDGKEFDVKVDIVNYEDTIDGKDQDDVFDGITYAG